MAQNNLNRLTRAKLVDPKRLRDEHIARLEKLTKGEITTLIKIKKKLKFKGKLHKPGKGKVEPFTFI